ncbi:MAG: tetratricopeptide repeat protein [Fibrobacter sp.]|nr:tetratricopeptide repeat protein [Fibrobacter sp.]
METGNFDIDVLKRSYTIPVLVDFWAGWCSACKVLSPTLKVLHERHRNQWVLVKINVEKYPDLALRYNISAIPAVKLFFEGEIIDGFNGALPGHLIEAWLNKALPNMTSRAIKKAKGLLFKGDVTSAVNILSDLLNKEPGNIEAKVLYARGIVFKNPYKAKELVAKIEPIGETGELAESVNTLSQLLINYSNPDILPQSPAKKFLIEAISYLKAENFEMAFQNILSSIQADRDYLDGFSKQVCIALFRYLGEENALTKKNRRLLGTILYS